MKRPLAIALAAALLAAAPAQAASVPELATLDARAAAARTQRAELQRGLDDLARQIEALKAQGAGQLFGNAELDALLKRSQELSGQVADALRLESEAAEALRGGQSRRLLELEGELARLKARWDAAKSRDDRQALVGQLRALRSERDALRQALPSARVPQVSERPTDDPDELLERADAFYDGADKLVREQQSLEKRISELQAERDLERRMNEFLGEDALFDEHDRRLSISRPVRTTAPPAEAGQADGTYTESTKTPGDAPGPAQPVGSDSNGTPAASLDDGRTLPPSYSEGSPGKSDTPREPGVSVGRQDGADPVAATPLKVEITRTPPERRGGAVAWSEDESLEELAARREKLRALADELRRKGDEAVKKAGSLD